MKQIVIIALILTVFDQLAVQGAEVAYQVDPDHTVIGFSIRHMVISDVKGRFNKFSGVVAYDPEDISTLKASGTIDAASVDTSSRKRDEHLRSADFFDVAQYPNITFESARVEKQGDGYVLFGNLTIRGVTKEVALPIMVTGPITDPWGKTRIGIEVNGSINRKDFGIVWGKVMDNGGLLIGDEVKIAINAEAVKQDAPTTE